MSEDVGLRMVRSTRREQLIRALLIIMPGALYFFYVPRGISWNEQSHLVLTYQLFDHHTAVIDPYAFNLGDRSFWHGHYYSDKAPGLSLLALPVYALLRLTLPASFFGPLSAVAFITQHLIVCAVIGIPTAFCTRWLYLRWSSDLAHLTRRSGQMRRAAATLALGTALAGLAFPYSTVFFSHQVAALLLFAAFVLLSGARPESAGRVIWAGVLAGVAVACEYPSLLFGALLGCGLLFLPGAGIGFWSRQRWSALFAYTAGGLAGCSPALVYNTVVFGAPWNQGYAHLGGSAKFVVGMSGGIEGITLPSLTALMGETVGLYRGLLPLCPWLLLAVPGIVIGWRAGNPLIRWQLIVCGAISVSALLFNASYHFWWGGYAIGPRQIVSCLYFFAYPVLFALTRRYLYWTSLPLFLFSCMTLLASVATHPLFPEGWANPVYGHVWPLVASGVLQNSWGSLLDHRGQVTLALVALLVVAGAGAVIRLAHQTPEPSPRAVSAIALSAD